MNVDEIKKVLEMSMNEHRKIAINYKDGESHFGWITEPTDTLNTRIVLMVDGEAPHTVELDKVASVELTNEYF